MSIEAKRFIQQCALDRFKAEELWIDPQNSFWGFFKENDKKLYVTEGYYIGNDIIFSSNLIEGEDINNTLEKLCETKRNEGFTCFAIEM